MGTVNILKLDAATGYTSSSSFASYSSAYYGVTGLDFDGQGNLYVSERSFDGDAGIIRQIDSASSAVSVIREMNHHRPTGIDADNNGNVFYTGRRDSDGTFGNVYKINELGERSELLTGVVGTCIALDSMGRIFISTPGRDDLPLLEN